MACGMCALEDSLLLSMVVTLQGHVDCALLPLRQVCGGAHCQQTLDFTFSASVSALAATGKHTLSHLTTRQCQGVLSEFQSYVRAFSRTWTASEID